MGAQAAQFGYDVLINIVRATDLPGHDWWNGLADPYVKVRITTPGAGGSHIQYRTRTAWRDLNPTFDEFFEVGNLPEASCLGIEVWDKDLVTPDDVMGTTSWVFVPQQLQQLGQQLAKQEVLPDGKVALRLQLPLQHPRKTHKSVGSLDLEVQYKPSKAPGAPRMLGPVRYRQHLSPTAGRLMRCGDEGGMAYSTYKLFLCHITSTFEGVKHSWNRNYPNAQRVFNSSVLLSGVRSQHSSLYATQLGTSRAGVLQSEADFFALFNNGMRGGQRRYFTYTLLPDSLRCSETGAAFFTDMMSKHAMHAGGAEEVLYAGEFCIVPDPAAAGRHRLVIDNNSGTYAPLAQHLPRMRQLFLENFPAMAVETLAADDPRLEWYHQQCPSRV